MIIGRMILAFITALSRIIPGVKPPKHVEGADLGKTGASVATKTNATPRHAEPTSKKPVSIPDGETHTTDLSKVKGIFGYGKELFKRFTGDQCPAWAAALSFFSITSLPSVLLCGLAVLGFVIKSPAVAERQVEKVLGQILPGQSVAGSNSTSRNGGAEKQPTAASRSTARGIIQDLNIEKSVEEIQKRRGWTALIGLALLFWSAIQIFVNASVPINAAFRTKETRNFIQLRVVALGLLASTGVLFVLSLLPASGVQVLNSLRIFGTYPDPTPFWLEAIFWAVAIAINAALFTLIYRFLPSPSAKVSWKDARFGGIIAAVLWEIAKQGFALYLQRLGGAASYDKLYGSLGSIFLLVFWIYYTSMILLLGAEIAKLHGDLRDSRSGAVPAKA
jgi:membrane protein